MTLFGNRLSCVLPNASADPYADTNNGLVAVVAFGNRFSGPAPPWVHNTTRDAEYRERSFRLKEAEFMQYLCKNFPALREFNTPYLRWRCAEREYCNPVWGAQFAFDGVECHPMTWDAADDASFAAVPLVARAEELGVAAGQPALASAAAAAAAFCADRKSVV